MNDGLIPMYDESGQQVMMTPEAALRAVSEGSAYPYDPTAIYSPEAAQQLAEFTAALQGEDVYTRRLQALAQQYGAQTQQYSAVAQNAYNMGQLLMNASINNPYQYAQQAFNTNGSAPGFARALAQGFSYGEPTADPFDADRLKGWDFGRTSTEQATAGKSQGAPDYGGPPAQSSTPPAAPTGPGGGPTPAPNGYTPNPMGRADAVPVAPAYGGGAAPLSVQAPVGGGPGQVYNAALGRWVSQIPGAQPVAPAYTPNPMGRADAQLVHPGGGAGQTYSPEMGRYVDSRPGGQPGQVYSPEMGRWVDAGAASGAYSNTAAAPAMASYGALSGVSGHGDSDIAHVNKEHDLIRQHGYGHGSEARSAAYAAAGMRQAEFNRLVKHGKDPFKRNQATGGMQVATRPETVHVGEGGRDELLVVLPLERPGTAVPGFAAQIANDLHPQGNYVAHGGASPPGIHLAQGGAVYGSGVNTLGVGNYRQSGTSPTPQGSVRVYANRGGMKTAPVTEGILPAMQADPTALDRIAANKFLAASYDSLLRQQGYAGLDDYLARNQAARPQQRVQAGVGYRGF